MESPSRNDTILVIGYGNTLRRDDGAGYLLARDLHDENLPGLHCVMTHQLTPEMSALVAEASEVIFVDAYPCPDAPESAETIYRSIHPAERASGEKHYIERRITHGCSPERLMDMTRQLYVSQPPASLIAIPGFNFTLGEEISSVTRQKMHEARDFILRKLFHHA